MMQFGLEMLKTVLNSQQQQQDYRGFIERFNTGHPADGYTNEEAFARYREIARPAPTEVYQQSAEETFARMSPQEREDFGRFLELRARQNGVNMAGSMGGGLDFTNPNTMASMVTMLHEQGVFSQLLGGQAGEMLSNPLARAALAGIAATVAQKVLAGR